MKWTLKNEVVNPIIKVKYLSWTKLTFKDCQGNIIPIAQIPGTFKGGLTAAGSSLLNAPAPSSSVGVEEWGDGLEGEGAVQLIGRFKEINIQVEKTAYWLDYWTITMSEQVCTSSTPVVVQCDAVVPTCSPSGAPSTMAAAFTKNGIFSAIGTMTVGTNSSVVAGIVSTSEVLNANTNHAASTFADPACYSITPLAGGLATIKDIGGNNTTTISSGLAVTNPLIYVKDITRIQLDFANTVDINGSPVCCMKKISGGNGFTVIGTKVTDDNPTENGSATTPVSNACGIIQLVGTFRTITINSSRPSGDIRFNNWSVILGGEPVCMPDNIKNDVLVSAGLSPVAPGATPVYLKLQKRIANIKPKNPSNPAGNQIVTFEIIVNNFTTVDAKNIFLEDKMDAKFLPGAIVAVASPSKIIRWVGQVTSSGNAAYNGASDPNLITSEPNVLKAGGYVVINYAFEINPSLIPANSRHNNTVNVGSTTDAVFAEGNKEVEFALNLPKSVSLPPASTTMSICSASGAQSFSQYVQSQAGTNIVPNAACGSIKWSWTLLSEVQKCGNASTKQIRFKGTDGCSNSYEYDTEFVGTDECPPIFDMLPMDKTVECSNPDAIATVNMWLAGAGGAWFGDVGQTPQPVTVSHDYTVQGCVPGKYAVKFTLSDACGNKISASANLTVLATSTIILPPTSTTTSVISLVNKTVDKTIYCNQNAIFDTPDVKTTCTNGVKSKTFDDKKVKGSCPSEYEIIRTWTIKDECNATFKVAQSIAVTDNTPPVFNPNLVKVVKISKATFPIWKNFYLKTQVKATDECSATVTLSPPTFTNVNPKITDCQVDARDECGNISSYKVRVIFIDVVLAVTKESQNSNISEIEEGNNTDNIGENFIAEEVANENFNIYPNPTSNTVNVPVIKGFGQIQNVRLYNSEGRIAMSVNVEDKTSKLLTIDISSFTSGSYLIEMEYSGKRFYRMVQKINR